MSIIYKKVRAPEPDNAKKTVLLTDETIQQREEKILSIMDEHNLSSLIIYADKEHGSNFEYLVGFVPRFEEGLLIYNRTGNHTVILGNENYNKTKYSRIAVEGIKCSLFSLPNQPMKDASEIDDVMAQVEIDDTKQVGLVGWKMMPKDAKTFDMPHFIVSAIEKVVSPDKMVNATGVLMSPDYGARVTNNANEIAHYEYWSSLASDSLLEGMNQVKEGVNELDVGDAINKQGQYNSVVTIVAFGERFLKGNLYPRNNELKKGDKVALTVGYKGGLSSRTGYAVENEDELEAVDPGYLKEVVYPYFEAYLNWFEQLEIGKAGGDFYREFSKNYPPEVYGWELCPGHLTADEEWLSSPFYENSKATVKSGMLFQVDFIPSQEGHHGVSAESTIAVADGKLRKDIEDQFPDLWHRIKNRRDYLKNELNIELPVHILPLASTLAYYRPFLLNHDVVLVKE